MGEQVATGRRTLTARYALDHVLARGGAGEVWRARDLRLGRPVAVKMLHGAQTDPQFRTRFEAEARHTARLSHPHIATVYDYGEEEGVDGDERTPYLVLELVEGESLADLLARRGRLGVDRTLSILRQLSSALAAAHEAGVVHRDVKPANVLVRRDGVVKITDFGIAASAAGAPLTAPGQVVGTARYLSPEQARGGHGTPASDVYALGLVGYECLAGHPAFDGDDPVDVAMKQIADPPPPLPPDVPPAVRGLVSRATAKDPARRLPDGAALHDAVDRLLAAGRRTARSVTPPRRPAAGRPPSARPAGGRPAGRRRWWLLAVVGALLCALATALLLLGGSGPGATGWVRTGVTSVAPPAVPAGGHAGTATGADVPPGARGAGSGSAPGAPGWASSPGGPAGGGRSGAAAGG